MFLLLICLISHSVPWLLTGLNLLGDESPEIIEGYEEGIVVSYAQNFCLVDWDGNIKYQEFFRAPGHGAVLAGRILKTTVMVAGTAMAKAYATQEALAIGGGNYAAGWHYGAEHKK